jgi:hypothetical protein
MKETAGQYSLSLVDNLAMARFEPFGLHLFEFILLILVGVIFILAFLSFLKNMKLYFRPTEEEIEKTMENIVILDVTCSKCEWRGKVPKFDKVCADCGCKEFE